MNKKEAILNAALELLVVQGVHNTPMSQVAKAAGTGIGTIYNYFPNKESLLNAIYLGIKEKEAQLFLEVASDGPVKTQFERYMSALIEFFMSHPSYFMFLQQLESSPIITEENKTFGQKPIDIVATLLKQGQNDRIVKAMDMENILVYIGGGFNSYLKRNINKSKGKQTPLPDHLTMMWDGIKA